MKKGEKDLGLGHTGPSTKECLAEALERLVQLYDDWDKPHEAAKWRQELQAVPKQ